MRQFVIGMMAAVSLAGLAACDSPADKKAEKQADALESQAAATTNEAKETQLNAKADTIEQQAGNADGGATTKTTPDTSPSK
jgi:hypothetical protein